MTISTSPMLNPACQRPRAIPRFGGEKYRLAHRKGNNARARNVAFLFFCMLLLAGPSILCAHEHPASGQAPAAKETSSSDANAPSGSSPSAGNSMEHSMSHDGMQGMEGMDMSGMDMGEPAAEHEHAAHASGGHAHSAATPSSRLVLVLLLITLAVATGLILFARRSLRYNAQSGLPLGGNLLDRPIIGKILRSRLFLTLLIVPTMAIFSFIVITGLLGEQNTGNPAVLLTWILWWPAVIFTFFILGRIWCAICPFGYLGDVAQKIFSFRLKVPAFMRNMWWRLFFFLALTWATTLWALDRWPTGTAWLALGETIGAILLAFVFEKRAFCRFVCPVGGVFGLYSMTAPTHIGVKDSKVCHQDCPDKNCYEACAWFQYPATVDRNTECSLCMDCVRACPHDNLTLQTQPFGADLMRPTAHRKSMDEATAIVVVLGVALLQTIVMLNGWADWQATLGNLLHIPQGRLLFTISYVAVGVVAPILLVSLVIYLSTSGGSNQGGFSAAFRTYAFAFLPLGLALHAAHNFHHLFGEGNAMWTGLKKSLAEMAGMTVVAGTEAGWVPGPNTLFTLQWVALLGGLFLAFRVGISLVRRNSVSPQQAFRTAVPILLFATAFTVLNLVVLSSSMAHRH